MNNQWMKRTILAMSIQVIIGGAYAADEVIANDTDELNSQSVDTASNVEESATAVANEIQPVVETQTPAFNKDETPSLVPKAEGQAADALQKKEGDATQETNLTFAISCPMCFVPTVSTHESVK